MNRLLDFSWQLSAKRSSPLTYDPMPSFSDSLSELTDVISRSHALEEVVTSAGTRILNSLRAGHKLLTCGNGGSAADALHLAEELVGRYKRDRRALPAVCLNADVTALTCIANDYGYDQVFARGVDALGCTGDVLVGFTTSGNSPNIIKAFQVAKDHGVITILVSGKDGGALRGTADHEIIVPSQNTARIQEIHTLILHQWLEVIDTEEW